MEAYNNSAITLHNIGLFTRYSFEEGFKEGLKEGFKERLKERLEKGLKGKMDTDEMETFIETVLDTIERDFSAEDIANFMGISIEQRVNDLWEKSETMNLKTKKQRHERRQKRQ
jgi:hypothetical protein